MVEIDDKLISDDVFARKFVCDLAACKGACCVEGDAGAPLEDDELEVLETIYDEVKPYMRSEGIEAINENGFFVVDTDGDFVTPLVNDRECAYVTFEEGIAKCAIEQAFNDGKINFKKPISCHLFPIRITPLTAYDALNYDDIEICKPACNCGEQLQVPTYKFLKEPIVRKYGQDFYSKMEAAAKLLKIRN